MQAFTVEIQRVHRNRLQMHSFSKAKANDPTWNAIPLQTPPYRMYACAYLPAAFTCHLHRPREGQAVVGRQAQAGHGSDSLNGTEHVKMK